MNYFDRFQISIVNFLRKNHLNVFKENFHMQCITLMKSDKNFKCIILIRFNQNFLNFYKAFFSMIYLNYISIKIEFFNRGITSKYFIYFFLFSFSLIIFLKRDHIYTLFLLSYLPQFFYYIISLPFLLLVYIGNSII